MKVLLHVCCAPCASACVPRLKENGNDVTIYFANSNIDTREEFEKRRGEAQKLAANDGVELVCEEYNHEEWLKEVASGLENEPERGARCEKCFRYNLKKAASFAAKEGFDAFTTSLSVSPHKISKQLFAAGKECETDGVAFLEEDFKKREGFKISVKRAKELSLYRQNYCGCEFSKGALRAGN